MLSCLLRRLYAQIFNVMSVDPESHHPTSVAVLCKIDCDLPANATYETNIMSVIAIDPYDELNLRLEPTTMATGLSSMLAKLERRRRMCFVKRRPEGRHICCTLIASSMQPQAELGVQP